MAIWLWCIRVSQARPRPGDARGGEDVSRRGEDVSRDELSLRTNCLSGRIVSPLAAGTGDHKDYRSIVTLEKQDRVRTAGRVEPEETRTTEGKPGLLSLPPEKCRGEM